MSGGSRVDGPTLTSSQTGESRLGPAEVHHIVRQHLDRLAIRWGLERTDAYRLAREMHTHTYAPGEVILPSRVQSDFLGLIVRGQVGVVTGQQRFARQVAILLPGSTFGDASPTESRPSDRALQALTRCEIWFVRRADLEALADKRRAERRAAALRWLLSWGSLIVLACLLATVALGLPSVRRAAATAPMGLGQWCKQQAGAASASQFSGRCAEWAWELAASLAAEDANPRLALGTLYFERGEREAAEEYFEIARGLDPDLAEIHNNLGLVYASQGKHELAIAAFERALDLEPGTAAIEHNLGLSLQAIGAHGEALTHYQLALSFGEPRNSTLANLAIGYYETGQPAKAAETAQQILRYDETIAPAHAVLGAVALESQQPKLALTHLQRAIALNEDYSQAYFFLGLAYEALGLRQEATVAFEQALVTAGGEEERVRIRRHLRELYEAEEQEGLP